MVFRVSVNIYENLRPLKPAFRSLQQRNGLKILSATVDAWHGSAIRISSCRSLPLN